MPLDRDFGWGLGRVRSPSPPVTTAIVIQIVILVGTRRAVLLMPCPPPRRCRIGAKLPREQASKLTPSTESMATPQPHSRTKSNFSFVLFSAIFQRATILPQSDRMTLQFPSLRFAIYRCKILVGCAGSISQPSPKINIYNRQNKPSEGKGQRSHHTREKDVVVK